MAKKKEKKEEKKATALKPLVTEVFFKDGKNYEKITFPDGKVVEREQ